MGQRSLRCCERLSWSTASSTGAPLLTSGLAANQSALANAPRVITSRPCPFARQLELLETIPGVGRTTAEVLIAETGGDMSRFRTAGHLASWAGVCPDHHESADKHKSGRRRHGNRWLGAALGTAAMAASRTRDTTYLGARYMRLPRLGRGP
ncbi:IS110 family transposase [Streptomyces sp. NPDC057543]|uniref:IS110 family transposase n=1 Tax=Streptomyces sp. NPDC057543 TaxID=3346163 RepID=UPI0036B40A28